MKILVFKKNSAWGVIKHPVKGNIYNHTIDFLDRNNNFSQALKDEFINKYLSDTGVDYKVLYELIKDSNWSPINEIRWTFNCSPEQQNNRMTINELEMSDTAMIKRGNEYLFYTLKVLQSFKQKVLFEAELDIFFSYTLIFRPKTENYIERTHWDRWLTTTEIDKRFLSTQEPSLEYSLISKGQQAVHFETDPLWKKIKWLVVYPKQNAVVKSIETKQGEWKGSWQCKITNQTLPWERIPGRYGYCSYADIIHKNGKWESSGSSKVVNTVISQGAKIPVSDTSIPLPYGIWLIPFSVDGKKMLVKQGSNSIDISYVKLTQMLGDNEALVSVHIVDSTPTIYQFLGITNIKLVNNQYQLEQTPQSDINIGSGYFELIHLNYLDLSDIRNQKTLSVDLWKTPWQNFKWDTLVSVLSEPVMFSGQFYQVGIKKWNTEQKTFSLLFLKIPLELNWLYTYQPENYQTITWFSGDKRDNFLLGNVMINNQLQELPSYQDAYVKFMRENKNQLEVGKRFDKVQLGVSGLGGVLGLAGSLATANPLAIGASVAGMVGGIMGGVKSLEMREALLDDTKNKLPSVLAGNTYVINNLLARQNKAEVIVFINQPTDWHQSKILHFFLHQGYLFKKLASVKWHSQNRYYYNFIQANDTFNTIYNKFSPLVKQIIDEAFSSGITFWHFRKKEHWTNILDYNRENWEMNVLRQANKI